MFNSGKLGEFDLSSWVHSVISRKSYHGIPRKTVKKMVLVFLVNSTTMLVLLILALFFMSLNVWIPATVLLTLAGVHFAVQYYNSRHRTRRARSLLLGLIFLEICTYSLWMGPATRIHYFFFVMLTLFLLLYSPKRTLFIALSTAATLIPFLAVELHLTPKLMALSAVQESRIQLVIIPTVFICLLLVYKYFVFATQLIEQDLTDSNDRLKEEVYRRQNAEKKIRRYADKVEQKNRELEQFTFITSHDLQEPTRIIRTYVELFAEQYKKELGLQGLKYLQFLDQASQRMTEMVKSIMEYSRIGMHEKVQFVHVGGLMRQLQSNMASKLEKTNTRLFVEELPEILGYPRDILQLFGHLIANSIKYQPNGNTPVIRVYSEMIDGTWHFVVEDNGIGIAPKEHRNIFHMLHRLHHQSTYKGTGMGLAQCKKIVELHGGDIWVESKPGKGARFIFTLPMSRQYEEKVELRYAG